MLDSELYLFQKFNYRGLMYIRLPVVFFVLNILAHFFKVNIR